MAETTSRPETAATAFKYERAYFLEDPARFDVFDAETARILRMYFFHGRAVTTKALAEAMGHSAAAAAISSAKGWRQYARQALRPEILKKLIDRIPDFAERVEEVRARTDAKLAGAVEARRATIALQNAEIEHTIGRLMDAALTPHAFQEAHGDTLTAFAELSHEDLLRIVHVAVCETPLAAGNLLRRALLRRPGRSKR